MKVGLIDVDSRNFPNLPLMKLSAWHKQQGDSVEWYSPLLSERMDIVYKSKVFSFTEDYNFYIDAEKDVCLPYEVEHIYPDYSLYGIEDTAYGFLSRGCPRGCSFCHVGEKEGLKSVKVADLNEFWRGQKNIVLCDPNILACSEWRNLLQQLIDSKAWIDINQGLDIRLMTEEKAEMISKMKVKELHFAWDKYEEKDIIVPKLKMFKEHTKLDIRRLIVYVLCNYDTTFEQDLERIYTLRELGYWAYVMLYDKENIPRGHKYKKLQRWANNRFVFARCERFEDYKG